MHSLLLQHCTPYLELNMKGMDTYYAIEIYQDGIEVADIIHGIYHLKDGNNQDAM